VEFELRRCKYVQAWAKGRKLDAIRVVEVEPEKYLEANTAHAYLGMVEAAALAGITLHANSCWRSFAHQKRLRDLWELTRVGPAPALPGYSRHHAGIAVDIQRSHGDTDGDGVNEVDTWLAAHAGEFEFKRTVAAEAWHWERI
jgi:LAS superfamily LD-carboxypeptidase LdcB